MLSKADKIKAAADATAQLIPIITKYQITDANTTSACVAAFQAGIQFAVRKMEKGDL